MLAPAEFKVVLDAVGEPVEVHMAKPPATVTKAKSIMQSTSKAHESIVAAYGVGGKSFQFAATDVVPNRLDQILLTSGERFTIDEVVKHFERGTGTLTSTTCYVKGR